MVLNVLISITFLALTRITTCSYSRGNKKVIAWTRIFLRLHIEDKTARNYKALYSKELCE